MVRLDDDAEDDLDDEDENDEDDERLDPPHVAAHRLAKTGAR